MLSSMAEPCHKDCSMTISAASAPQITAPQALLNPEKSLNWYAIYTCSRHEKAIARHFEERGFNYFLPLYQAVHRWNKRSCRVSLPLFPGYIFVQTATGDRHRPLRVPGVLHYVGNGGSPVAIADEEIDALRRLLISAKEVGPHPYLSTGQRVKIVTGPLAGLSGIIQRTKSGNRFVVSVEMLKQSVSIEIDGYQIVSSRPVSELKCQDDLEAAAH
jgi:transcription antitermination factor NusG